jgi:alpha-L-fucosidase
MEGGERSHISHDAALVSRGEARYLHPLGDLRRQRHPESWSFFNEQIPYPNYLKQCDGFTAANYDPQAWADLFARAGARYAVLTTKHHDGVALWDTQQSDLSVVDKTPAGRDLITPFCDALRARDLKVGLYFSTWTGRIRTTRRARRA